MLVISKELIKQSQEIVQLDIIKKEFENICCTQSPISTTLQEDCHEIITILESINYSKNLETIAKKVFHASKSISILADKYSNLISQKDYDILVLHSHKLKLWADVCIAASKINQGLTENSTLEILKEWAEWIEIFAEAIDNNQDNLSKESWINIEKLAKKIIAAISVNNDNGERKNHYRRCLKYSANFILSKVETNKSSTSWKLVIGQKPYQELLKESQKRIHRLDELEPKNSEEAKKQSDILDYLEEALKYR